MKLEALQLLLEGGHVLDILPAAGVLRVRVLQTDVLQLWGSGRVRSVILSVAAQRLGQAVMTYTLYV